MVRRLWLVNAALVALLGAACANQAPLSEDPIVAMAKRVAEAPAAGAPVVPPEAPGAAPVADAGGGGTALAPSPASPQTPAAESGRPVTGRPATPSAASGAGRDPGSTTQPGPPAAAGPAAAPAAGPAAAPAAPGGGGEKHYDDGVSDDRILFGSVSSTSGLTDLLDPRPARAYFKYLNASRGGVNGRKLELLIYNDQFDATRNAALTRQAVEQDKVFALTANMAPLSGHGSRSYIEDRKIPVVGGDMVNLKTWGQSPMFYPQSYLESVTGGRLAGRYAVDLGCKVVAGIGSTIPEADAWTINFEKGIKDKGLPGYVYYGRHGPAESDFNVYVSQMKAKGADCITHGAGMPYFGRLRKAMAQQQYFPKLVMPSSAYDPAYVATTEGQPRENDYSFVQYDILENAGSNPAIKEFVDNVSRFEPGARYTGFGILAWTAAKLAADVVARMGNNLTRQNLVATLDGLTGYQNGITPNLTFQPGPHPGASCGNVIHLNSDGSWRLERRNYCL